MDENEILWKPISLTLVEYPSGDYLGYCLAWSSLLPIFLVVGLASLIVVRRDLHTICVFAGILFNEAINQIVKKSLKHPRPSLSPNRYGHKGYGMPSDHSQFMAFFTIYFWLFIFIRVYRNNSFLEDAWKYFISLSLGVTSVIVLYSRVYLGYHTMPQIIVGAIIGAAFGLLWFFIVHVYITPFFLPITNSWLGTLLMLRDSTLVPNVLWFEYVQIKKEGNLRRYRNRKCSTT